jgi:uncharacterized OB-fold protein
VISDPPVTQGSEPFWDATRERRLLYQWCERCRAWVHYPRPRCPRCTGDELAWREPDPVPTLHSWALHPARGDAPARMVILVDAADGLRTVSNLEGPHDGVRAGHPLALDWRALDDGRALPVYRLAAATPAGGAGS